MHTIRCLVGVILVLAGPAGIAGQEWRSLFDGESLEGWTVKIRGHRAGEDPYRTFRMEDGLLTVGYEGYDGVFGERFGHLFHPVPWTDYDLRVEYRFVGEQVPGGPGWALLNSGVMLHAQSPETMGIDQDFPISLEAQLLADDGSGDRPTANLCTPGTHVEMGGERVETHCIRSASPTFAAHEWVTVELEVRGGETIVHRVEGDSVIAYGRPVVGGGAVNGFTPAAKIDGVALDHGWIALQSESHPVQFRAVSIRPRTR
ncbi:MAG: DUF1080 domain-containing protein [Longimicrobiales bacterium]